MRRERLDVLVHRRGLAESRERARRLILAGEVLVEGQPVTKAAAPVHPEARIEVKEPPRYVSRGGLKLEKALEAFAIDPGGWLVADVGASTGGFTDCLLQHGAERVYAIDVGYGQLAWSLRQDPRVVVMERTNARYLEELPEAVRLVTIDASFISLRLLLPQVRRWLRDDGEVLALVKPQFEAGRRHVGRGGIVRSRETHRKVLRGVVAWAHQHGWHVLGLTRSPIEGAKGNVEFFTWLGCRVDGGLTDPERVIADVVAGSYAQQEDEDAGVSG